jgi:hypothetical protein
VADLDSAGPVISGPHMAEALFLRGGRELVLGEDPR